MIRVGRDVAEVRHPLPGHDWISDLDLSRDVPHVLRAGFGQMSDAGGDDRVIAPALAASLQTRDRLLRVLLRLPEMERVS